MKLKGKFEDYTEVEFVSLIEEIASAEGSDDYQGELIYHVCSLSEHPDGLDLIFYNEDDNITPQGIVDEIKAWRAANNKPGFKS